VSHECRTCTYYSQSQQVADGPPSRPCDLPLEQLRPARDVAASLHAHAGYDSRGPPEQQLAG
jgi:hypothetical protein